MSDGLPYLPDWIEEKLYVNEDYGVQLHFYVEAFLETDDPWLSVSYISSELGVSRVTTRKQLTKLDELGILDSDTGANGRIYWVHDNRSDYPIPPDVEVEPMEEPDELTVSELTDRGDVMLGLGATVAALIGSLFIAVAIASAIIGVGLPANVVDASLLIGFAGALGTVVFAFAAVLAWVYRVVKTLRVEGGYGLR